MLVFTGGIGENSALKRKMVLELLKPLGFTCDVTRNDAAGSRSGHVVSKESAFPVAMVIPTNEELVIASETLKEVD